MEYRSLSSIQQDLMNGALTAEQLVDAYLIRIEEHKNLNAFLEVFSREAVEKARLLDQKIKHGEKTGRLAGMVIGIKDNICYKDHKVSASSRILEGYTSIYNATVTERLLAEDAIIIGRLNCDEFAMGSSNENSAYGAVKNPVDPERVPGGSSGGSAAALAANLCTATLGSDTGGSIRQPAALCGLFGLKPTYGRVSRYGLLAYGSSFDQIGPFTHTAEDAALLMEVMAGKDPMDSTSSSEPVGHYLETLKTTTGKKKFAVLDVVLNNSSIQPEINDALNSAITALKAEGHEVETVHFPYLDYLVPAYYVLTTAEASSNLSRYDGIHYGYRSPHATDLESTYRKSRSEGFGKEVKRRIMLGTFVLSSGYYDAYYTKAQKARQVIRKATLDIFNSFDFILLPTTVGTAFKIGQKSDDPIALYLEDIFTVQANITGIPAISVPCGKDKNGLPIGLQLMSAPFTEGPLLQAAAYLHQLAAEK